MEYDLEHLKHISVKNLHKASVGDSDDITFTLSPSIMKRLCDLDSSTIQCALSLVRIDAGILCRVNMTGSVEAECRRCLKKFLLGVEAHEDYECSRGAAADPEQLPITAKYTIDITQSLIDTFVPDIPHFPLHTKDCKGLCLVCGVNLNDSRNHFITHPEHRSNPLANRPHLA